MERKLVKQGQNALTTTLPAFWIKERGLKVGDVVQISVAGEQLIIQSSQLNENKTTELNLKDYTRSALFQVIISAYIAGYDKIVVYHNNSVVISEISKELIGVVLEEHNSSKSIFSNLIKTPEENLSKIINRMRFMLKEQANTLIEVSKDYKNIKKLEQNEKQLDYNVLYCMRYIQKFERTNYNTFLKCVVYDQIGDLLTEIGYHIGDDLMLAKKIKKIISTYVVETNFILLNKELRLFRNSLDKKTFVQGLTYSLAEQMYNFLGYLFYNFKNS